MATVFGMTATATTEKAWEIGLIFGFCDGNCRLRAVYPLPSSDSIVPSAEIERGSVGRVENGRMGEWGGLRFRSVSALDFRARYYTITGGKRRDCSQSTATAATELRKTSLIYEKIYIFARIACTFVHQ